MRSAMVSARVALCPKQFYHDRMHIVALDTLYANLKPVLTVDSKRTLANSKTVT